MTVIGAYLDKDAAYLACDSQLTYGGNTMAGPVKYVRHGRFWAMQAGGFHGLDLMKMSLETLHTKTLTDEAVRVFSLTLRQMMQQHMSWSPPSHAEGPPSYEMNAIVTDGKRVLQFDATLTPIELQMHHATFCGSELAEGAYGMLKQQGVAEQYDPASMLYDCLRVQCERSIFCSAPIHIIRAPRGRGMGSVEVLE